MEFDLFISFLIALFAGIYSTRLLLRLIRSRKFKNYVGKIAGFRTCPNCNDSLRWKPSKIVISRQDTQPTQSAVGVEICNECLSQRLNKHKILDELKKRSYDDTDLCGVQITLDLHERSRQAALN